MMHRAYEDVERFTLPVVGKEPADAADIIRTVLASPPMQALRCLLDRQDLQVESEPIVYKDLSDSLVRLMFPVTGGPIVDGAVVSAVCLFDRRADRTLYAHPMHAGPSVNPLVQHSDGPMAAPKSQADADGDRATRRIIEHKRALWDRFLQELPTLEQTAASRRWRDGYYWSLQRLYFCSGCAQCKWGSPFFDGPDPSSPRKTIVVDPANAPLPLDERQSGIVADILSSSAWRVEAAYAERGGFAVIEHPHLLKALNSEFIQVVFPTNASLLQGGALVAASFTYHLPSRSVALAHCLAAGPESEIQFLRGDVAFDLPKPQPGTIGEAARTTYRSWRLSAWSRFWLNELESGLTVASATWLREFRGALEALFGGNDLAHKRACSPLLPSRRASHEAVAIRGETTLPVQALENIGGRCFSGHAVNRKPLELRALGLSTLMVNLGRRCNQACHHCHVDAGPDRTEEMTKATVDLVLRALRRCGIKTLDLTGGAPEMNPHFRYLVHEASRLGCRVVDRCNLTIFFEPGHEDLPEFLAEHGIQITASLPSDQAAIADRQRGVGSFTKSITALQKLNALGYGKPNGRLTLNLVYNPSGTDFATRQEVLERRYKRELCSRYGIEFDRLWVMNNMPINRFEDHLRREGRRSEYMNRLARAFNPDTVDGLMCRHSMSVGWDGRLYDCDFNQAMDIRLSHGLPGHIRDLDAASLSSRTINTGGHCFGCTAGAGSSCNGALAAAPYYGRAGDNGNRRLSTEQPREASP